MIFPYKPRDYTNPSDAGVEKKFCGIGQYQGLVYTGALFRQGTSNYVVDCIISFSKDGSRPLLTVKCYAVITNTNKYVWFPRKRQHARY